MSLSSMYETDPVKEKNGVELVVATNDYNGKDIKVLIARRGGQNTYYKKRLEALTKPYRHQINNETLPDIKDREISARAFAEGCLKGWENVPLSDITGNSADKEKLADFNVENAYKLLMRIPDLANTLYVQSAGADLYKLQREEDLKN